MEPRIPIDPLTDTASPAVPAQPRTAGLGVLARIVLRLLLLAFTLLEISARFALLRLRRGSRMALRDRAEWLHRSCRLVLHRAGIRTDCRGPRPSRGLICANHLSYLDIVVCAAATPCVFVSKREVKSWPAFGFFAQFGGTIFLDRESRASADAAAVEMAEAMDNSVPVLLFPEGTSTDGAAVLRFHPTLLEPAIQRELQIVPAAIAYRVRGGEERDVCYYDDISFVRHLLRTLGRTGIAAEVEFYPESLTYAERKAAALDLHDKVEAMRRRMMRDSVE
jgi:lyso-ornithine lipid O-acyltransferase